MVISADIFAVLSRYFSSSIENLIITEYISPDSYFFMNNDLSLLFLQLPTCAHVSNDFTV